MMKYFLSGASGIRAELLPQVASLIDYRLLSMHEAFKSNTRVWCAVSHDPKSAMKEVMLDSGAFTAYMKKKTLKLEDLIRVYDDTTAKLKKGIQVWYINLDVIPGEFGRAPTPEEIEKALDQSDINYKLLKKRYGSRVLPVFHQTEGISRLRAIIAQNDYVGLSFRQDFAELDRVAYAEEVLTECRAKGVRTHGLATTGLRMLRRTAFDSADSASWLYKAAMGYIFHIDQQGSMGTIAVSSSSPKQSVPGGHFVSMTGPEKEFIMGRVEEAGVTMEQLATDLSYRILFNAFELKEWLEHHYKQPKKIAVEKGLFAI